MTEDRLAGLGLLSVGAAHELATPLATIAVLLGDWRRHPLIGTDPALSADLAAMEAALTQARRIAEEWRSALVPHAPSPARPDIGAVLAAWASDHPGVALTFHPSHEPVDLPADPTLAQALRALLDNAARASPAGVELIVEPDGPHVALIVRDQGPGFSTATLDRVMAGEPVPREGGFGLGLFLARLAAERSGGRLTATNRPGGGAEVRLILPRGTGTEAAGP